MEGEKPLLGFKLPGASSIRQPWALLLLLFTLVSIFILHSTTTTVSPSWLFPLQSSDEVPAGLPTCTGFFQPHLPRKTIVSIKQFGGVGDGKTLNSEAFRKAVEYLKQFSDSGGSQLIVPKGRWVTGSFNLTSHFTLYLEEGAVILGSEDPRDWPIIEPLPSYGRGRERLGGRHISLIHGNGLTDVVITGKNGTIDGQGKMWWDLWWNRTLERTRGHLVELISSQNILIYNLTFQNSPFWTVHPVYCSNVVIKNMTMLAPLKAPNTDGVDADSSTNVCIEDCYIESGDDLVAIKSGWDQYGIKMARPSSNIIVRRVSGTTPTCSGIGIGSEMSGGISNVLIEDIYVRNSAAGVRLKTDVGRGGYITNITINNIILDRVKVPIKFSRAAKDHPDDDWDRQAVPKVHGVFISNVVSLNSIKPPTLLGVKNATYEGICLRNISIIGMPSSAKWQCEYVSGFSSDVNPPACPELLTNANPSLCSFT